MKIFIPLAISILLASILFCPMGRAAPPIPDYVQIVSPDPSLPKELSAFFGKYEGISAPFTYFVIVAKIDEEKATLYIFREGQGYTPLSGWETVEAEVFKERGKYQLWYRTRFAYLGTGSIVVTLQGKYLELRAPDGLVRLTRVP